MDLEKYDFQKINLGIQPQVLVAISKLDPEDISMDFKKLENILKADQNMTAVVLRVGNSKFFAHGKEIKTLQHAISLLGFKMLRSLAMLASTKSIFGKHIYSRFKDYVWKPSIATGLLAKEIAAKVKKEDKSEELFIMGLLHKIGQVIFNAVERKKFIEVLNKIQNEGKAFIDAEKEIFGMNYVQIGTQAAEAWGLPMIYRYGIRYHIQLDKIDESVDEENKTLIHILAMAHYIANKNGFGHAPDASEKNFQMALNALNLSEEVVNDLTVNYPKELNQSADYKYYISML